MEGPLVSISPKRVDDRKKHQIQHFSSLSYQQSNYIFPSFEISVKVKTVDNIDTSFHF